MRTQVKLQKDWWVSISARDAALAASRAEWTADDLEVGGDPENQPQLIALPGGPQYGKRQKPGAGTAQDKACSSGRITDSFVGPSTICDGRGNRLPNPFLSYAKRVAIPKTWAGHKVFLHLDNTRYYVTVSVNGRRVAQYVGGLEPHRLDVTRAVTPGRPALIVITVGDSGTSGHRRFDPYNYTGTRLPTCKEIENNLVHPVNYGGSDRAVGKVTIEAVPLVRIEYVFADPKVSRGLLRYTVVLANDTAKPVRVRLQSAAVGARPLVDEAVAIPARAEKRIVREIPWADAVLWDTDNPHLYALKTTLTRGAKVLDVHGDYFGFREFTINGHSFYLNGKKIHLFGQSGHTSPDHDMNIPLQEKMAILRAWKEKGNVVHIRLHAKPQDKGWVEAADRVGMLITTETALWTTGFHSFDWAGSEEACYRNVRNHFLEALVRRDRNSPSVVIWSLSNEMSPITPFDLANPKMAAMTRAFKRILAETRSEDGSRVVQMSSAMDFLGNLAMYNLHYPKNWQAFPDYPHTAYWLDKSFLFPWYGPRRQELPSWGWRKDKPLYFGEFTCVFGATPDNQASIVGDVAFEREDFGTALVNEKLWPLEIASYRRLDVSGFCAWACMCFTSLKDARKALQLAPTRAHTYGLRPLAVICHTYRARWFAGDEIALELSIHNDARYAKTLDLVLEVTDGRRVLWTERMPPAVYGPAENKAFTSRCRAPAVSRATRLTCRATLRADGAVVDRWEKELQIAPRAVSGRFPAGCGIYDADGSLAALFDARGIRGAAFVGDLADARALKRFRVLWVNFAKAKLHAREWARVRGGLDRFVRAGGRVVLDGPADYVLGDLPVKLRNGKGYADGERLEITYAYNVAPFHPALKGLSDADFSLWGGDYYVARRCFETPQEGNAMPLLVAGTDRHGLTSSPLLELRSGRGAWLVSSLEVVPKLLDEPRAVEFLFRLAACPAPGARVASVGAAVTPDTLRMFREVGYGGRNAGAGDALAADIALLDGERLDVARDAGRVRAALKRGGTVYVHDLGVEKTRALLAALRLRGAVKSGKAGAREYDTVRHGHPLADGMTSSYLYWIVNKAKVAAWTLAPLHPEPASALVRVAGRAGRAQALTRRGAAVVFEAGRGRLVVDNLRWQLAGFDEPERPRRYVMALLTNLGVPLAEGAAKRFSREFETEAERRERGHF